MSQYRNGAEGGVNGTTATAANTGGASGTAFAAVAAGVSFSNAHPHEGLMGYGFDTPASAGYAAWTVPVTDKLALRSYHYFENPNSGGNFLLNGPYTAAGDATAELRLTPGNLLRMYLGSTTGFVWSPDFAMPVGQQIRAELLVEQGTTTTNGRARGAVFLNNSPTPLVDSGWIEGLNLRPGTHPFARARYGKNNANSLVAGVSMDDLALNDGVDYTGQFIGATTPELATPVPTVIAKVNPTTPTSTDGSLTFSWPAVAGAARYETDLRDGTVTGGFVADDTNAVSPKTYSGLDAGPYTLAVRAIAP